jgi:hypothetical protein
MHSVGHGKSFSSAVVGGPHPAILPCPATEARRTLTSVTPEPAARITAPPTAYAERLTVPWWSWVPFLIGGAALALEISISAADVPGWIPFVIVLPVVVALMVWVSRLRVAVTPQEFQVDDARLPVEVISGVVALDAEGKREILGVGAHPTAFVVQRPWIGGAVQVLLDDPADPTPYWVVSTRKPVELATALLAAAAAKR